DTAYGMFFYNRNDGTVAVGNANQSGRFVQTFGQYRAIAPGYDQVIVQGSNILLYNETNGSYAVGGVGSDGKFYNTTVSSCGASLLPGYKKIIAVGTSIFFYSPDSGAAAVGVILPANRFLNVQCWGQLSLKKVYGAGTFGLGWTNLVNTSNG